MARAGRIEISEQVQGETVTLSIEGELDLSTIPVVERQVDASIGGSEASELKVDLSDVSFMDSSGLRLLIELCRRAQEEGWRISLTAPRHEAATLVLRMTGADAALPFVQAPPP
jgi:anti-sigma B factor antagonist